MSHAHDGGAAARKSIYRTAGILTGLTVLEFIIAGTKASWHTWMGIQESTAHTLVVVTFVILTIFKAFYIVAEFMHLGSEVRTLALTIVGPFVFVMWLLIGLILEGGYWGAQTERNILPQEEVNKVLLTEHLSPPESSTIFVYGKG